MIIMFEVGLCRVETDAVQKSSFLTDRGPSRDIVQRHAAVRASRCPVLFLRLVINIFRARDRWGCYIIYSYINLPTVISLVTLRGIRGNDRRNIL